MILIEKEKYGLLADRLRTVDINISFALSVIDGDVKGKVYVDEIENPETVYIVHPYGLTLLYGKTDNKAFNESFRDHALNSTSTRDYHEWMQAYPNEWEPILTELFGKKLIKSAEINKKGIIELNTRVNFKFNLGKYLEFRKVNGSSKYKIVRTDKEIFNRIKGIVIPGNFWDSAEDFINKGIGFSLFYEGKLASTAYSACVNDGKMEIGIETGSEFRKLGLAQYVCTSIIEYCIENDIEPVWSCRLENIGSYNLALKLGFEPTILRPFYRLSN